MPSFIVQDTPAPCRVQLLQPTHPSLSPATPWLGEALQVQSQVLAAHETFLRMHTLAQQLMQTLAQPALQPSIPTSTSAATAQALFLDRQGCMSLAIGQLSAVLGPRFATIDALPSRVRLPDEPLMLVDRILSVEGQALQIGAGRVVTEHDVLPHGWYLDGGRIPTCIAVEAGQADLFLSGYLGIDLQTKGLAMYRLLDAVVTFSDELPRPGQIIHYDIHIDEFFELDHTWFFRFWFDASVDGRPLMTMRQGCAGFFTPQALEAGKGLVGYPLRVRQARPSFARGQIVQSPVRTISEIGLDALRAGDLVEAFGESHRGFQLHAPLTLAGGRMRLVHRIVELDAHGGAWQVGKIVGEADVDPQAWYLTCHFVDDKVMPGTLMYECCLHTLRVLLLSFGWVGENEAVSWQPILGRSSRLKCRGQVLQTTRVITYEIHIQEFVEGDEPAVIAFARMYADGKAIVEIEDMTVRLLGATYDGLRAQAHAAGDRAGIWRATRPAPRPAIYTREQILEFSAGQPSRAFGAPYLPFDGPRAIARLPRPPFQFLDRIVAVHGEPFVMKAGATCESEFDLDPNHWSFSAQGTNSMPFAVLLEVALQPCGWLAAYVGSALVAQHDLRFRNLGGKAIQHQLVRADAPDTLAVTVTLRDVSHSGGMIVQNFDFAVRSRHRGDLIYDGVTTFGFFSIDALAHQVGIRGATWQGQESPALPPNVTELPRGPAWPNERYRMIDSIEALEFKGGPAHLGYIGGAIVVDPQAWFFTAHFMSDPVWPGSLGLEAFVQLVTMWIRHACARHDAVVQTPQLAKAHAWTYRGQIVPKDRKVRVEAWPTAQIDRHTWRFSGQLAVDGRIIYRMDDFVAQITDEVYA